MPHTVSIKPRSRFKAILGIVREYYMEVPRSLSPFPSTDGCDWVSHALCCSLLSHFILKNWQQAESEEEEAAREHSQERVCSRSRGHQAGPRPSSSDVCITGGKSTLKIQLSWGSGSDRREKDHGTQTKAGYLGNKSVVPNWEEEVYFGVG